MLKDIFEQRKNKNLLPTEKYFAGMRPTAALRAQRSEDGRRVGNAARKLLVGSVSQLRMWELKKFLLQQKRHVFRLTPSPTWATMHRCIEFLLGE